MKRIRLALSVGVISFVVVPLFSQQHVASISVDTYRPLARAAATLEPKLGIPINYEDPLYSAADDLEDVTERVANSDFRAANPSHRVLAPRKSRIQLELPFDIDASSGRAINPRAVMGKVVQAHAAAGGAGEFAVTEKRGALFILPIRIMNRSGIVETKTATMQQTITLRSGKLSGVALLEAFCDALTRLLGHRVGLGTFPGNLFLGQFVDLSQPITGPAWDVLAQALGSLRGNDGSVAATNPKFAWALLYDPDMNAQFLNIRVVTVDVPSPFGGTVQQPLY